MALSRQVVNGAAHIGDGRWQVTCDGGATFDADKLVLAAGAWSSEIAAWLGYDIPMAWERGYHQHLEPGDGPHLRQPIYDVEAGFVIAPMRQGIRLHPVLKSPVVMHHQNIVRSRRLLP